MIDLSRRLAAEALGTALLVATVVGSGIMADRLTDDVALALLGNTLPTGAMLVVLITIFGPLSGAHFNPVVSMVFALRGEITARDAARYMIAQIAGAIAGTLAGARHVRSCRSWNVATTVRTGAGQWIAEAVATFGLVVTILLGLRARPDASRGWSASTSRPPTGSRPRPRSPTRRSRSRAPFPTRSPESGRSTCRALLLRRSPADCLPRLSPGGCSVSGGR